jgi:chromosomal replication initiation ATPase DnaA
MSLIDRQEAAKARRALKERLGLIPSAKIVAFPEKMVTTAVQEQQPESVAAPTANEAGSLHARVALLEARVSELTQKLQMSALSWPTLQFHPVKPIVAAVAKYYDVSISDILSKSRYPELTRARHIAMYLARKLTLKSTPDIGRILSRDHSSVWHGIRQVERRLKTEPELLAQLTELSAILEGRAHAEI